MAQNKWRISGGLGEPEVINQVMTQGLGFPLRPVDGAPSDETDLSDLPVAEGLFMQWQGSYQPGLIYPAGSVVLDSGWTMIANVATVTKPAPIPEGSPTYALPDTPAFGDQSTTAVVYSGHLYTFTESGWIKNLRVWVPELSGTTNYRVVILDVTNPANVVSQVINDPILTEDAWKIIAGVNKLVLVGTKLQIYIDALNSGSDTPVIGGWNYNGSSGNAELPALAGWTKDNQNETVRINKTDLDSTDRTTELSGFIPSTSIQFAETAEPNYSITFVVTGAITDNGTDFGYVVSLTNTGPSGIPRVGNVTTMTAAVPVAQSTVYSEVAGTPAPAWATVSPFLEYDGQDQAPGDVAFGVDIEFDIAVVNPEWDIMATTEL